MADARRVTENLSAVRDRIAAAAVRSGRSAESVTLVAVTKYAGPDEIEALLAAGCRDLGESRPQQLWERVPLLAHWGVRWHMIGHLQRNKANRTVPLVLAFTLGDSLRLGGGA